MGANLDQIKGLQVFCCLGTAAECCDQRSMKPPASAVHRPRQLHSRPILDKLHDYLLEIRAEVLPKSPQGRAGALYPEELDALPRYCADGI